MHERDGGRCAYRDKYGRRCAKRHDLEFHHKRPFARGGDHSPTNLTLMCKVHNTLVASRTTARTSWHASERRRAGRRAGGRLRGVNRVAVSKAIVGISADAWTCY